ncbi:MAG: AMP-binding protein [Nanoarchaeota archaeon]
MVNKIYEPKIECADRKEIEKIQIKKFNKILKLCKKSELYKKVQLPSKILSLEEIKNIPLTTKDQLRNCYPYGSLTLPLPEVIEVHTSSGTTGNPVPIFLTKRDLETSNKVLARTWFCNGIRKEDIFMMMGDYGLFTGGLLNHYALTYLGAMVIPMGVSSTGKQIKFLKDFKVTSMAGIASHYFRILEKFRELKINPKELNLRVAIAAGEPYSEETRAHFENGFNCKFMDQYGLAEINTGLAGECTYKCGLHIPWDYVYPEIINQDTQEVLPEGEIGELVLTTLNREANPVIRYRTGDITSITYKKCKCGRTTPRISRIIGRVDDILFVKGIKLYPSAIESTLWKLKDLINPEGWKLKIERIKGIDELTLIIEPKSFNKETEYNVACKLKEELGIRFNVCLERNCFSDHKLKRIIDLRKK